MLSRPPSRGPPSALGGALAAPEMSAGELSEGEAGHTDSGGNGSKRRKVGAQKRLHEDTRFGGWRLRMVPSVRCSAEGRCSVSWLRLRAACYAQQAKAC